jgi:hypothetical protein
MRADTNISVTDALDNGRQSGIGPGAIVLTADGELPVEWLSVGDMLVTRDNGAQPVLAIVRQRGLTACGTVLPDPVVLFPGDCVTTVKPWEKLRLAPGHRVLLRTSLVQQTFGLDEALARPGDLTRRRAPRPDPAMGPLTYFHLIMPRHELIMAGGLWLESTCPDMVRRLGKEVPPAAAQGLLARPQQTVRPSLTSHQASLLRQSMPRDLSLTDLFAA